MTTISRSAAALCAAGMMSLGFAATASAEPTENTNSVEYWEAVLEDEGFVNPVCTKDDKARDSDTYIADDDYLIVVLEAGSDEDENTVFGYDEEADEFVGVEEGEELATNDGMDISHIITCDADRETGTPAPTNPGEPTGPIVETDIVESGESTAPVALGGAALLAGVGASVLVLRRKGPALIPRDMKGDSRHMAKHSRIRVGLHGATCFSSVRHTFTRAGVGVTVVGALALTAGCGSDPDASAAPARTSSPSVTLSPSASVTPSATRSPTATPKATRSSPKASATPRPTAKPLPSAKPRPSAKTPSRVAAPMTFSAPSIDVSGPLKRTSAVNGVVNPPAGVLGWITGYGRVRPGEVGTGVIAGHVVDGKNPGVFVNLEDIRRGAKITVVNSRGKLVVYTVTATRVATKQAVSHDKAVWGANQSVRRIALITCDDDDGYRADGHRVSNFVAIAEAR